MKGIDLKVLSQLHPESAEEKTFEVVQFQTFGLPLVKTDTETSEYDALLFLGDTSAAGFDVIIGEKAGYFRIVDDPEHPDLVMVQNLNQNQRLWSDKLWSDLIDENEVRAMLEFLRSDDQVDFIMEEYGSRPCEPRPIPLDLVRAAVMSCRFKPIETSTTWIRC